VLLGSAAIVASARSRTVAGSGMRIFSDRRPAHRNRHQRPRANGSAQRWRRVSNTLVAATVVAATTMFGHEAGLVAIGGMVTGLIAVLLLTALYGQSDVTSADRAMWIITMIINRLPVSDGRKAEEDFETTGTDEPLS
jgi:hypothetical protein